MSASAVPVIGLLDAVTGAGNGPSVIAQGEALMFANRPVQEIPISVIAQFSDTATGGTATVIIETSNDGAAWTTWQTMTFAPVSPAKIQNIKGNGALKKVYVRARVSAMAGTAPKLSAYMKFGQ